MICPLCRTAANRVIETIDREALIYRRRQCQCGHRWTTYETPEAELRRLRKIEQAVQAAAGHLEAAR